MKIVFFTRLFYPHKGGVEKHVYFLSQELIKKGHNVVVITEQYENDLKKQNIYENIYVYRIPVKQNWFKKFVIWKWLWNNRQLIKNADIVHAHDVFFWYFPFHFLYPEKRIYITFHGYEKFPISLKAVIIRKLSEKLSHGNICIGDFIPKWYYTKPTYISYGAVNLPNKTFSPKDTKSALFFGRLDEQTGILTYVRAIEKIKNKIPKFKFLVIGDGKYRKKIQPYAEVKDFMDQPEKLFANFRFAFVSRYLSILEAMAAKRLVFAVYNNSIKKDYLKLAPFNKLIINTSSPETLTERVLFFIKHPGEEKKIVDRAYEWVKNQTWESLTDTYLKLWNSKSS